MTSVRDDTIPEDLAAAVHDAAGALAGGNYELARVMRRRQTHRRRTVAGLSLVSVLVMALAVAVPLAIRSATGTEPFGDRRAVPQRLFYHVWYDEGADSGTYGFSEVNAEGWTNIRVPSGVVELDRDGQLLRYPVPGPHIDTSNVFGLPGGGMLVWGNRWPRPGDPPVEQPDDSLWKRMSALTVINPDGTLRVTRDLGVMSRTLTVIGADDDAAYVLRGDQLLRHEFASGAERPVPVAARVRELLGQGWTPVGPVVANRVVLSKDNATGVLARTLDLSRGDETPPVTACAASSMSGNSLALAPGGRRLACAESEKDRSDRTVTRLTVTEAATGLRVDEREFGPGRLGVVPHLAWADDHTLRLAFYALPDKAVGTFDLRDILKQETITL